MQAISQQNQIYTGANNKTSLFDISIPENWENKLVIFVHGFMGFKDWGAWGLVQEKFLCQGFGFLKYNVSHNGGTIDNPIDFPDPDSFGRNTYSKELKDLEHVINLALAIIGPEKHIYLIGHSRGGGIVLLESMREDIAGIATWAAISDIEKRFLEIEKWKAAGVRYQKNARTQQELPMLFDIYTDFISNKDRLNIKHYCENSKVPTLVVHGKEDTSVDPSESQQIASWLNTDLMIIENAQHTFNSSHPWDKDTLPIELNEVCDATIAFFKKH